MIYIYCLTLSDWFTLCGAIGSIAAIVVALFIAFSQERKNQKRINEKNKNIGETICALIQQLNSLVVTLVKKGYQDCISKLDKDDVSLPMMTLIPMTGIKKLSQFSPDILYRVFKYFKLTSEDYKNFVLSLDSILCSIEFGFENYNQAMRRAVSLKNEFQDRFKEFNLIVFHILGTYKMENKTEDPMYIGFQNILNPFLASKESEDFDNIRFRKNELVDKIRVHVAHKVLNDENFMKIYNQAFELDTIFTTLQNSNKQFKESLHKDIELIAQDMRVILGIKNKLKEQCK